MTRLDESQLSKVRDALSGPQSGALIDFVVRKNLHWPTNQVSPEILELAHSLAWTTSSSPSSKLTTMGHLIADPLRELYFYRERSGQMHNQGRSTIFEPERYKGKRVLELGSGFGCNILTLVDYADRVIGVEIQELYVQLAPILFELEGKKAPAILKGQGEAIPVDDNSQDVVIIFGALQYMDIDKTFSECDRVLVPGGEVISVNGHIGAFSQELFETLFKQRSLRQSYAAVRTFFDTLVYQLFGKRLHRGDSNFSTSVPIYPSIAHQKRLARHAGLLVNESLTTRIDRELCLVLEKPN